MVPAVSPLPAVVEDIPAEYETLQSYFSRMSSESGDSFEVRWFPTGREFLVNYQPIYDMVLMDISLPDLNGMQVAKSLRKMDQNVVLIFVTSMARYAADGVISSYGNLKDVESKLNSPQFIRCNRCYLMNLTFVRGVKGSTLLVGQDELQISRPKRNAVLEALNNYLGGGL